MQPLDLLAVGLTVAGAGAIGLAVGGALAVALKWRGGETAALAGAGLVLGAALGLIASDPSVLPALPKASQLADLVPKFGMAYENAEMARVLKAYYPDDWAQVQPILAASASGQTSDADAERALRSVGFPLLERQLPLASTENISAYLSLTRDEQQVLAGKPELCLRVMTAPSPDTTADMIAAMPEDLKAREAALAVKVLEQTATHPQPPHPTADTDQELSLWSRDAVWSLSFDERDALRGAGGDAAEGAAYCKVFGVLLNNLSFDYPPDAAEVYKSLLAKGAARMGT